MVAYVKSILPLIKKLKAGFPDIVQTCYFDDAGSLGTFAIVNWCFNSLNLFVPNPPKSFDRAYRKSQILEKGLACVAGLRCARDRVVLAVLSEMTSPNMIGWKRLWRHGNGTSIILEKPQRNIPRTRSQEWMRCFRKPFCLAFSSESQNLSHPS